MLTEKHAIRLWKALSGIYGGIWKNAYGHAVDNTKLTDTAMAWLGALNAAHIDQYQIRDALQQLVMSGSSTPPTLPAFIKLCKPEGKPPALWQRAYESDQQRAALPPPTAPTPEISQELKDATKPGRKGRRCIFSPGYGWTEYRRDLTKAKDEGRPLYEVDMAACARHGWTEADEEHYRAAWLSIPGNNLRMLYPRGHLPSEEAR